MATGTFGKPGEEKEVWLGEQLRMKNEAKVKKQEAEFNAKMEALRKERLAEAKAEREAKAEAERIEREIENKRLQAKHDAEMKKANAELNTSMRQLEEAAMFEYRKQQIMDFGLIVIGALVITILVKHLMKDDEPKYSRDIRRDPRLDDE